MKKVRHRSGCLACTLPVHIIFCGFTRSSLESLSLLWYEDCSALLVQGLALSGK